MIKNYLKKALRNLKKRWAFTLISAVGLAIGTGAFIVLVNYADIENNYDSFQKDEEEIYVAGTHHCLPLTTLITDQFAND